MKVRYIGELIGALAVGTAISLFSPAPQAHAAVPTGGLFYSAGEEAGVKVSPSTYLGFEEMCFKGQAMNSVKEVWGLMLTDGSVARPFIRYDKNRDAIIYGYHETACKAGGDCRVVHMATRCS